MAVSLGRLEVETADHVVLRYDLAGAGTRGNAALIDAFLSLLMVAGLSIGAVAVGGRLPPSLALQLSGVTAFAILACWIAYFVLLEWLWNGQTIGKRRAGLRVIGPDGEPARFIAVLIRNLVRPVDFLPGWYALGLVMIFLTPRSQRLGDLAAGTYVVRAPKPRMDWLSLRTLEPGRGAAAAPVVGSVRLSGESQRLVREFVARERLLAPRDRATLAAVLARPIRAAAPDIDIADDVEFLRRVAASLHAMGDVPPASAAVSHGLSERSRELVRSFADRESALAPEVRARIAASICATVRPERPEPAILDDVEYLRALAREIGVS
ncbi:MAG TPA: RDD family protein [Candidatus Limnocylindria bacterium]|nr:RDD family protein [Candidatus Limnocylindria bacterium]